MAKQKSDFPDFSSLPVNKRKEAFIDIFLPVIYSLNKEISDQHQKLNTLSGKENLLHSQVLWLSRLGDKYNLPVGEPLPTKHWFKEMLTRVDVLPPSLVLVQAANESAWGTSRFAQDGNNYFGMWCYTQGCGLVPGKRTVGETHEVAVFDSLTASVRAYFKNINTNSAYQKLRSIRATERKEHRPLDSLKLIEGLDKYSQRGKDYVQSLRDWIKTSGLKKYDTPQIKETYYQQAADLFPE